MTPVETLAVAAEVEASKTYQGIVFATAVRIVMRRQNICMAHLARELGIGRPQLRVCVERQRAPRNAWELWPRLAQVLES